MSTESVQTFESSAQSSSSASPANCEFGIKIEMALSKYNFRNDPEHPDRPIRPQAWRMKITVLEVNNIDPEIFIYNMGDLDPEEGTKRKFFQNIASPTDIVEYPIGAPLAGETPAFFRLASIDFVHRSLDVLDTTWDEIKNDITELIDASARLCELEAPETFSAGILDSDTEETEVSDTEGSEAGEDSSEVPVCPTDDIVQVEITESTDPEFPVGTLLNEVGSVNEDCQRTWQAVGSVSGYSMTLTTSLLTHTAVLLIDTGDQEVQDQVGLSDNYGAMLHYAYSATQEHSISISGS